MSGFEKALADLRADREARNARWEARTEIHVVRKYSRAETVLDIVLCAMMPLLFAAVIIGVLWAYSRFGFSVY